MIVLDSSFLIAFHNERDSQHEAARDLMVFSNLNLPVTADGKQIFYAFGGHSLRHGSHGGNSTVGSVDVSRFDPSEFLRDFYRGEERREGVTLVPPLCKTMFTIARSSSTRSPIPAR